MREAAIWATTFAEWPVFRTTLTRMEHGDSEERIRQLAALAMQAIDTAGVES